MVLYIVMLANKWLLVCLVNLVDEEPIAHKSWVALLKANVLSMHQSLP